MADLKSLWSQSAQGNKAGYVDVSAEVQGSKLAQCVVMAGAKIGKGCVLINSVVGPGAVIEGGCQLKDCQVAPGCRVLQDSKLASTGVVDSRRDS
jgi:ADP-glucose pyrophosphorylase